jgi:hypothetical protein
MAEEALLKRCSHFELDMSNKENAMEAWRTGEGNEEGE